MKMEKHKKPADEIAINWGKHTHTTLTLYGTCTHQNSEKKKLNSRKHSTNKRKKRHGRGSGSSGGW